VKGSSKQCRSVLAIAPSRRGFGFAVLEGTEELIDWGVREIRREKNAECLKRIAIFIERYRPDVIVIEDYQDKESRRCARIKKLLEDVAALALSKKVRLKKISRSAVRRKLPQSRAFNKHQIARQIGQQFPELEALVPPVRKPWMDQDARMSIFDALTLALML
jgi:RNase H-fold protein (predicted Holliday junction resolvase)